MSRTLILLFYFALLLILLSPGIAVARENPVLSIQKSGGHSNSRPDRDSGSFGLRYEVVETKTTTWRGQARPPRKKARWTPGRLVLHARSKGYVFARTGKKGVILYEKPGNRGGVVSILPARKPVMIQIRGRWARVINGGKGWATKKKFRITARPR